MYCDFFNYSTRLKCQIYGLKLKLSSVLKKSQETKGVFFWDISGYSCITVQGITDWTEYKISCILITGLSPTLSGFSLRPEEHGRRKSATLKPSLFEMAEDSELRKSSLRLRKSDVIKGKCKLYQYVGWVDFHHSVGMG